MDSQTIISYVLGAISGLALAVLKTVPKIVEDIWTDHRVAQQRIRLDKSSIVSQLLLDLPRGMAQGFVYPAGRIAEDMQKVVQIARYDKEMSKQVQSYLNLWRYYSASSQQFDTSGEIFFMGEDDEPEFKGHEYLEELSANLHKQYDLVIDLLNKWKL